MKMRRTLSAILATVLVLVPCYSTAYAAKIDTATPQASPTLTSYYVKLFAGEDSGEIHIDFGIVANAVSADSLGVELIKVYDITAGKTITIYGSTSNKLIATNTFTYGASYRCLLSGGHTYMAEVTVFSRVGEKYDSRVILTNSVLAPY